MRRPLFRLTTPTEYEADIHAAVAKLLDWCLVPPALWCCYPAGGVQLEAHEAARLARLGLKRSMPDILVFFEGTWGIELKRPGGQLSKTRIGRTRSGAPRVLEGQEDKFPKLVAAGFRGIVVCTSVESVVEQLKAWKIPNRCG